MYELAKNIYFDPIREIKVIKETDKTVTIQPDDKGYRSRPFRQQKESNYSKVYPTWEAAHDAAIKIAERKLAQAKAAVIAANTKLEDIKNMKKKRELEGLK